MTYDHTPAASDLADARLRDRIASFLAAFNRMDLDAVMTYFAPDAVYEPGDGSRHAGRAAIAAAFRPQFAFAWGAMLFQEEDLFVDPSACKAVLRWTCRVDLTRARFYSVATAVMCRAGRLKYGGEAVYRGVDILHFDAADSIVAKLSYAQFGRLRLRRG